MPTLLVVVAIFAVGYIAGVWTAFAVLRQPQRAYEDDPVAPRAHRAAGTKAGSTHGEVAEA
jgi:hypothetical protein